MFAKCFSSKNDFQIKLFKKRPQITCSSSGEKNYNQSLQVRNNFFSKKVDI